MALLHNWISGDDPEDDLGCSPECEGRLCVCQMPDVEDDDAAFAADLAPCEPNTDFPPDDEVTF
jgi:hypothetical protein